MEQAVDAKIKSNLNTFENCVVNSLAREVRLELARSCDPIISRLDDLLGKLSGALITEAVSPLVSPIAVSLGSLKIQIAKMDPTDSIDRVYTQNSAQSALLTEILKVRFLKSIYDLIKILSCYPLIACSST